MTQHKLLLLVAASVCAFSAHAQWQWIDKDGRKVFSDRPPPMDVPDKNIVRQPGGGVVRSTPVPAAQAASAPASAAAMPASAASGAGTGKDKELEEKKAQAEAAEAAKKKAEEQKLARDMAENCTRARAAKETLDSGRPISNTNAKGETGFMDEATRAAESKRAASIIASDCKR